MKTTVPQANFTGIVLRKLRILGLVAALAGTATTSANAQARFTIKASNVTINNAASLGTVNSGQAIVAFDYDAKLLHFAATQKAQLWVAVGANGSGFLKKVAAGGTTIRGSYAASLPVLGDNGRFQVTLHLVPLNDDEAVRNRIASGQALYNQRVLDAAIVAPSSTTVVMTPPPASNPQPSPVTPAPVPSPAVATIDPARAIYKNSAVTLSGLSKAYSGSDGYYLQKGGAALHYLGGDGSMLTSGSIVTIANNEANGWSGKWQAYKYVCVGSTSTLYYYPSSGDSTNWRIWKGGNNESPGVVIQTGDSVTLESMSYKGQWIIPSGDQYFTTGTTPHTFTITKQ